MKIHKVAIVAGVCLAHAVSHAAFFDGGFEGIPVPPGNFVFEPSSPHWQFTGVPDANSGVANGFGAWSAKANSGTNYAFIQRSASIRQTVSGLTVGRTYAIDFALARRESAALQNNANDIRLFLDTTAFDLVRPIDGNWRTIRSATFVATSTSHTIRFQGIDPGLDGSSMLDDVRFADLNAPPPILRDPSFEAVNFLSATWYHNPPAFFGSNWFYTPDSPTGSSGISRFGTTWGGAAADGSNFAFVQRTGVLGQDLTGLIVGHTYQIKFSHSRRPIFGTHSLRVLINSSEILGPTAATTGWTERSTATFVATSSSMRLTFAGVGAMVDGTSLVDNVRVVPEPASLLVLGVGVAALLRRRRP